MAKAANQLGSAYSSAVWPALNVSLAWRHHQRGG